MPIEITFVGKSYIATLTNDNFVVLRPRYLQYLEMYTKNPEAGTF